MGIGDILDEMIRLFRQNFRTFIGIAAVLNVPLAVLQMLQHVIVTPMFADVWLWGATGQPQIGPVIFSVLSGLTLAAMAVMVSVLIDAALASAISRRYLDRPISVGSAYRAAAVSFWRVLGATLTLGFVTILVGITIIGIPFAIFLGIRWALYVQAIVLEGKGVRQSLSRSSNLVKGAWWRVFGALTVATIMQYLVAVVPGGVIGMVITAVGWSVFPTDTLLALDVVNMIIGAALGILAAPILPIIGTLLYYDLRIRKEGFDLQMVNERLEQG